jgi:hypothetical protein
VTDSAPDRPMLEHAVVPTDAPLEAPPDVHTAPAFAETVDRRAVESYRVRIGGEVRPSSGVGFPPYRWAI